ncbi:protein of unknown function DUF180 [Paenibacillus curdlanolyticus YK9]|uniref:Flagellar assembly factor FliW n=1 Tax=Paenibacillus curdlanolyticus YK9 TaxID=717606 RepID=E0IED0_9BACL|nr:flagellar assembly protein FliW [Paenibacillus curdlanolyticus]EFM09018.1 protein of unknown function DUF180 [Paenibacillus curdlanolyticus YK9]
MIHQALQNMRIDLANSIIGFEHLKYFKLEGINEESPYAMLNSDEDEGIGFVVVSPFDTYPEYEFRINDEVLENLNIKQPEDVAVYSIVTVKQPFSKSTMNLVAPIVINVSRGEGRQVILNHTDYKINAELFPLRNGEEKTC